MDNFDWDDPTTWEEDIGSEPTNMQRRGRIMAGWIIALGIIGLGVVAWLSF